MNERFKNYKNLSTISTRVYKEEYYQLFFQDTKKD